MARTRDYKAEYARRKARGLARGLSLSQARGHPAPGETPIRRKSRPALNDERLEAAIKRLNEGASMTSAAKEEGVSAERMRRAIASQSLAKKVSGRWVPDDKRLRRVPMIKDARVAPITVDGFEAASAVGKYHNGVQRFANTQNLEELIPFRGEGVTDVKGKFHPFETDPNALLRYLMKDEPGFAEIYAITVPI